MDAFKVDNFRKYFREKVLIFDLGFYVLDYDPDILLFEIRINCLDGTKSAIKIASA